MSGWEIAGLGLLVAACLFYGVVVPLLVGLGDELADGAHQPDPHAFTDFDSTGGAW